MLWYNMKHLVDYQQEVDHVEESDVSRVRPLVSVHSKSNIPASKNMHQKIVSVKLLTNFFQKHIVNVSFSPWPLSAFSFEKVHDSPLELGLPVIKPVQALEACDACGRVSDFFRSAVYRNNPWCIAAWAVLKTGRFRNCVRRFFQGISLQIYL